MSVFHNNALIGAGAGTGVVAAAEYVIPKSLRFNSGDSSHLNRTPSSAGNRRTWTWSAWVKRNKLGSQQALFSAGTNSSEDFFISFQSGDTFRLNQQVSGSANLRWETSQVFRDVSAWYHFVVVLDTTQATSTDRVKIYVNGSLISNYGTQTTPSQNATSVVVNSTSQHGVGRRLSDTSVDFDGLMADIQFVDGQALAPTDFGETRSSDGVWVPKEYTGEYSEVVDQSQNWTNLVTFNSGTWNGDGTNPFDADPTNNDYGTVTRSSGGYATLDLSSLTGTRVISVTTEQTELTLTHDGGTTTYTPPDTNRRTHTFDAVTNPTALKFDGKNSDSLFVLISVSVDGKRLVNSNITIPNNGFHLNFSDSSTNEALGFDSAPTTPNPDPKKGFDVVTWTGNGSTQNIGGFNFEPGLVWIKQRTTVEHHALYDNIRGATNQLYSNLTNVETTQSTTLTAFNPDGFSVGSDDKVNENGNSHVAWVWRAGGPAVANSDGAVNSQVSVNTDYGFSIVTVTPTATGQTVGHGLNTTPSWIIYKNRDTAGNWRVHHTTLGTSKTLFLNTNGAESTSSDRVTAVTSSTFTLGDIVANDDHVAYCWSEISGYSKFSSYSGTGSTHTVDCGFRPAFLIVKSSTGAYNWQIKDKERGDVVLFADTDGVDTSDGVFDLTDNGFTVTGSGNATNASGQTYIFAAFADRPGNNWDVNNIVTNEGLTTSKTQFDVVTYTGNGATQKIGGPVFSSSADSGLTHADGVTGMFDGSLSTRGGAPSTDNSYKTLTDGVSISASTGIRIYWNGVGAGQRYIRINGTTELDDGSAALTPGWSTQSSFSGTINKIEVKTASSGSWSLAAVEVDGTILIDGTGPGLKFQPDFVWIKRRDDSAKDHNLYDVVRGASGGYYKQLVSNVTSAENNNSSDYGRVTALNSDGFTVDSATSDHSLVNDNGDSYVAWCWKAGGTAVSNTDGTITSSVSANAAYGFSCGTYTGTYSSQPSSLDTVGHGLNGKVPGMIISKSRNGTSNWHVWHKGLDNDEYIRLNSTNGKATLSTGAGGSIATAPTGSVFPTYYIGGSNNGSSDDLVFYCFADVPGYQRISSYIGNGSSTGPVVVTGFKPRWILFKSTSSGSWVINDTQRDTDSANAKGLKPNASDVEADIVTIDVLENGFQLKGTAANTSGQEYLYMAIGDDEIGLDEDCLVDVPNAVTADADATDTTGGYQRGNYATLNAVDHNGGTLSNGNLKITTTGASNVSGTIGMPSGKYYWEVTIDRENGGVIGIGAGSAMDGTALTDLTKIYGYSPNGQKYENGTGSSYGATYTAGDVISVKFDAGTSQLEFLKNYSSQGVAFTVDSEFLYFPQLHLNNTDVTVNFGQMRFKYSIPSGYAALNTTALPAATIADGSAQFDAVTYTSDNQSSKKLTFEFGPDFFWSKVRNFTEHHVLHDSVRGPSKVLKSSSTAAESTESSGRGVLSFDSDGVTIGIGSPYNSSGNNSVVWGWNAGANSNKTYTVKVVSDGGNKYRFDDFGTSAVTLDLAEGSTYVFDQSDSSNSGHPLRFSTTSDGTHNSGSEYTAGVTATGTPGSAGAKTTIVVAAGVNYSSFMSESSTSGNLFDGSLSTFYGPSGNTCTFIPDSAITVNTSLEIYYSSSVTSRDFEVNDSGTTVATGTGTKWVNLNFTGSLTKISGTAGWNVAAIRVDGVILQDNNSTPTLYYYCSSHSGMGGQANTNSTAGASNFDGSIQSTVKTNPEAGFSIVTFTNTTSNSTVAHGLNAKPDLIIWKKRSGTSHWPIYHSALGATKYLYLNLTNAASTGSEFWNNTEPTSSVITTKGEPNSMGSAGDTVMYVMSAVSGYSAFGSYEGNGSSDGPFVHTGFQVRWLIIKGSSYASNWNIFDTARDTDNPAILQLRANLNSAEQSTTSGNSAILIDLLSNGFKLRAGAGSANDVNQSSQSYIWAAFAENPFSSNGGLAR